MNKKVQRRSVITFILSIVAMTFMTLFGGNVKAQTTGGSELSLDDVKITSFKLIDIANGNKEIEYRTSSDAQYNDYKNDPSKFNNTFNENQISSLLKVKMSMKYSSQTPLKEGDTLVIPASIDMYKGSFAKLPLLESDGHELGTWEYKDGKVVIYFSGDYIKNNVVTKFTASFETGEIRISLSSGYKSTKLGERAILTGKLGKEEFVTSREKEYIKTDKLNESNVLVYKISPSTTDSQATWQLRVMSDYMNRRVNGQSFFYANPYLLENNGQYSPNTLTDIYVEDTFTDVVSAPNFLSIYAWVSGVDDDGNVVSGDYVVPMSVADFLTKIDQGNRTREEVKTALKPGQYSIYKNNDGTYTFMIKWWDMNDPKGPKFDDIPDIKKAGGVGNYLKQTNPAIFGDFKSETIEKINSLFSGKAIPNVFFYLRSKYAPVKERTEIPNTIKYETKQTGAKDYTFTPVLTPSAGVADAPSDPLSIKLLKTDVKTGELLSEGFKFELQTTEDNGVTWKPVTVTANMVVSGTLNGDNTLTPNEKGTVEVNSLVGGKKYRFFEKAHADGYKDVTEDNANPNTNKTPTAANSRVVEINAQGSGKVVVMYNEQKPETVKVEGSKTWNDADNQDGKRPTQITVNLLKNGQKVASKTVTEADGWKWTFDNLEKSENGKDITYTVEEEAVEGYTATVNGYNITNTHTPAKTSVQVTKKWDDADDKDGKRPTSVTITLYANGEKTDKTLVLNKENNWTGSFTEVDEYKAGKKIDYSVQEEPVGNGYVSEISGDQAGGFTVTNTRKPDAPVTTETPTTTPVTTTTEEGEKELPNTGTTGSLAVIGFLALIGATLVLTVKNKKA